MAPKKKGKGKKGKKKGGKKKKMKGLNETPEVLLRRLLKNYENQCKATDSILIPKVKTMIKDCIENNQLWVKLIVEGLPQATKDDPQLRIEPLIAAIRGERYTFLKDVYVWDLWLKHENIATLALLIEKGFYQIRLLELQDCMVQVPSLRRLALAFNFCKTLTILNLDYNEFGDEGCAGLCAGLAGNKSLLSMSLCYCELEVGSGALLGEILATTALRELYLDGNNLGCEGAIELVKRCAEHAELEMLQKLEDEKRKLEEEQTAKKPLPGSAKSVASNSKPGSAGSRAGSAGSRAGSAGSNKPGSATDKKKKKKKGKKGKKGKKKKEPPGPPPCGPWIHKLHLADNGIDAEGEQIFAPVVCMRLIKKLLMYSSCLEELDLERNLIGDLGARAVMDALTERKNAKLPSLGVRVTHRVSADVYAAISKLGTGVKKKKGRKGKGKKGKKKK